jgi:hypothetical protein
MKSQVGGNCCVGWRYRVASLVSDEPGIQLFAFHGNVNKEMNGLEAGQMARDIIKAKNGRWTFYDDRLRLKVGDVIYYWLYVQYEGLGYQKLDQTWTVTGECPYFITVKLLNQPTAVVVRNEQNYSLILPIHKNEM